MGLNKDAQQRVKLLNHLLNRQQWKTARKLHEALNKSLAEPVEYKTITRDLKYLREELNAPLNWKTPEFKKDKPGWVGYTKPFTLPDSALKQEDIKILNDAAEILNGMSDFYGVLDLGKAILDITQEIGVDRNKRKKVFFEGHTSVENLESLPSLFQSVRDEETLHVRYQPFEEPRKNFTFYPYVLREYRNRWFLIGKVKGEKNISALAIDRIIKTEVSSEPFIDDPDFVPEKYFDNLIGAAPPWVGEPQEIVVKVYSKSANHIRSKPIHKNWELIEEHEDESMLIKMKLYLTYELKQTLLSYGDGIEVLEPIELRHEIKTILEKMNSRYQTL